MTTHNETFGIPNQSEPRKKLTTSELLKAFMIGSGVVGTAVALYLNTQLGNTTHEQNEPAFDRLPALTAAPEECNAYLVTGPWGDEFVDNDGKKIDPSGVLGIHVNPDETKDIFFLGQTVRGLCVTTVRQ